MGVLKCLCGPEGALNKLPVLISKHPFFISLFLSFLFIYIFFFLLALMFLFATCGL